MNNCSSAEPSTQHDEIRQLMRFLRIHAIPMAVGTCIILVAIIAVLLYRDYRRKGIEKASLMLSLAYSVQDLETLVAQHRSTPTAPLALMKLAKAYFDSGNYDMALNKYAEFEMEYPDHPLVEVAELGKAHCLEARGQLEEALSAFIAFSAQQPDHFLTSQAIFGQARCLEQLRRYREAKALCEDFVTLHPESGWVLRAEQSLAAINRKLEEEERSKLRHSR